MCFIGEILCVFSLIDLVSFSTVSLCDRFHFSNFYDPLTFISNETRYKYFTTSDFYDIVDFWDKMLLNFKNDLNYKKNKIIYPINHKRNNETLKNYFLLLRKYLVNM